MANTKDKKLAQRIARVLNTYGKQGVDNGLTIVNATGKGGGETNVDGVAHAKTVDNPTGQRIRIRLDPKAFDRDTLYSDLAHEGSHAADGADWVKSGFSSAMNPSMYKGEFDAFTLESQVLQENGASRYRVSIDSDSPLPRYMLPIADIWNPSWLSWTELDVVTRRELNINELLEYHKLYKLTPKSPKREFLKGARFK